ncbi:hypothetical protein [Kistimonas asteriae]|uniref:hypothetical protein n=1 Tax=Kistimonas asteriae TaxID=517724 RepID=UPI001BA5B310|nr:hypothetical protein [Kistimonas asteriae]
MPKYLFILALLPFYVIAESEIPKESYFEIRSNGIGFGSKINHGTHLILPLPNYCINNITKHFKSNVYDIELIDTDSHEQIFTSQISIKSSGATASDIYQSYKYIVETCMARKRVIDGNVSCSSTSISSRAPEDLPLTDQQKIKNFDFYEFVGTKGNSKTCLIFKDNMLYTENYQIN